MIEQNMTSKLGVIHSHDLRIDNEYVNWITEIKHRYRAAQVKASVRVNSEKLLFNWELGRDLVQKKAEEFQPYFKLARMPFQVPPFSKVHWAAMVRLPMVWIT